MLDKIIRYSFYLLAFLLPLWFLPWTIFPVALNKQTLLSVFVFLLFIVWMVKIIISGKLSLVWNKLVFLLIFLLLVLGVSTAFSGAQAQSFWGMSQETDTYFNFLLFGLVFFLFANLISINQLKSVLISVLASSGALSLLFLIQILLKKPLFSWDFANFLTFNPVGTTQGLGLFLGGAFAALMALISGKILKRWMLVSAIVLGISLFACIFIINYWPIWLGIALATVLVMAEMTKSIGKSFTQKEFKRFILPLIVLAFSLIFIFIRIPTQNIVNIPPEVSPTYRATFDIAIKTLRESAKNFLLGSGPATFPYQYSFHRTAGPNLTDFWQIRFNQGTAALPTFLATFGVLGTLLLFGIIILFFYQGFSQIYRISAPIGRTRLAVFVAGFYFFLLWFFYPLNFSLTFSAFLMLGIWNAISVDQRRVQPGSAVKEFSFTQSPQKAFFTMTICVVLIVVSIIGLYNVFQKYRGALSYARGLSLVNNEPPRLDEAMQEINQAALLDRKDVYFRNLSQMFLLKTNEILENQELSQEQRQTLFQQTVSNAELSATAAVQINPRNSQNWLQLGNVYENLILFGVEEAEQLAISNYQKTQELDPQNPQIPLNIGRVYKTIAEMIQVQISLLEMAEERDEEAIKKLEESRDKNLDLALEHFTKSAELKPNFSAAYYLIAQVYETQGKNEEAFENYQTVLELEPDNEEIQKKVEELSK